MEPKEIIRSRRKSLALTINEKGELIVHAPNDMATEDIMSFIAKKQAWITKKSNDINYILEKNKEIVSYNEIFFLGKRYKVVETKGINNPYLTNDSLLIDSNSNLKKKKNILKQWYLSNIETTLVPKLQKISSDMNLNYRSLEIINSKAKWGMCDSMHSIYLNWKLLMLSPEIVDYVIIHELSHIIELNHSERFWKIVGTILPNYKHYQEIIHRCQFLIKLY